MNGRKIEQSSTSDPPKQCQSAAPLAEPLILQSKPSIVFWNSFQELELGLKLELCSLTKGL